MAEISDILSGRRIGAAAFAICATLLLFALESSPVPAQTTSTNVAPPAAVPAASDVIYWKQDRFLIPYEANAMAGSTAATAVHLFVSRDHGTAWQKISEAKPNVQAFDYRTAGDGEYWFAMRTIDAVGRTWPNGPYQPELRVIVDATPPRIDALNGQLRNDGSLDIHWSATDPHLDAASWRIEVQSVGQASWQTVSLSNLPAGSPNASGGQATWQPPAGPRPVALRATVSDLAHNSTTLRVDVVSAPVAESALRPEISPPSVGWTSASQTQSIAAAATAAAEQPAAQPWPASGTIRAPYHLFGDTAKLPTDGVTRYGNPLGTGARSASGMATPLADQVAASPEVKPLQPFRKASLRRLPPVEEEAGSSEQGAGRSAPLLPAPRSLPPALPDGVEPKRVGSRSFALDYELSEIGRGGVSRVELWGTRDGGKTWHRYAEDDDQRSPIRVTVEAEGLYGFRVLAESAGGVPAAPPQPGASPELWVEVDLHRPYAELTAVEPGTGNQADHLVLHWRAEDDNLEPRPVALFYSSRAAGPWSVIASSLENTGAYAWRIERYLPARCYLRLEVRDQAGNLGAYQTLEPVAVSLPQASVQVRGIEPADSEAASAGAVHR